MGLERTIPIPAGQDVSWPRIFQHLKAAEPSTVIRMIDGMPAFPDEEPAADWKDVRVGLLGQMITVRRSTTSLTCVCWGTDDANLKSAFEKVVQACEASL